MKIAEGKHTNTYTDWYACINKNTKQWIQNDRIDFFKPIGKMFLILAN